MLHRLLAGALALVLLACLPAQARHHRAHQVHHPRKPIACAIVTGGGMFIVDRPCSARLAPAQSGRDQVVAHPVGCPHVAFCGCGAALEVFGRPIRSLWLARAWLRFPPASPGPGMAAVRSHHVMIIREYLGDGRALVYDANSGGHLTRVHVVGLRGYRIVNPKERYM